MKCRNRTATQSTHGEEGGQHMHTQRHVLVATGSTVLSKSFQEDAVGILKPSLVSGKPSVFTLVKRETLRFWR